MSDATEISPGPSPSDPTHKPRKLYRKPDGSLAPRERSQYSKAGPQERQLIAQRKLKTLRPRQLKYIHARADGVPPPKAAKLAGYGRQAQQHPQLIERNLRGVLQAEIRRVISASRIADKINAGLDATQTKLASFEGKFTDSKTLPDFAEQREYAKLAANLGGYADDNKADDSSIKIVIEYIGQ